MKRLSLASLILLAGCSLPSSPAITRYSLPLPNVAAKQAVVPHVQVTLQIGRVQGAFGLESERIQVEQADGTISYIAGVQWTEQLPDMLQAIIRASLENNPSFAHVVNSQTSTRVDALLNVAIERFTVHYTSSFQPPTVELRLNAQLISEHDEMIVHSSTISTSVVSQNNTVSAIMDAYRKALVEALEKLNASASQAFPTSASKQAP